MFFLHMQVHAIFNVDTVSTVYQLYIHFDSRMCASWLQSTYKGDITDDFITLNNTEAVSCVTKPNIEAPANCECMRDENTETFE